MGLSAAADFRDDKKAVGNCLWRKGDRSDYGWMASAEDVAPTVYNFPPEAFAVGVLERAGGASFCAWKGTAVYWNMVVGDLPNETWLTYRLRN